MTVLVSYTTNSVLIREPGPAGPSGVPGNNVRYQGQLSRLPLTTVSGIVQNVYKPVTMSGTLDSVSSGIIAGSGFSLRNNTGSTFVMFVTVATEASSGNQEHLGLMLTKNGAVISGSETRAHTGNSSSAAPITLPAFFVSLNNGEEIGIAVANFSSNVAIDLERTRLTLSL